MKWICCSKHSHPSDNTIPWTNPHYIRTCTSKGCEHQRCEQCTLPTIEDWYSSGVPASNDVGARANEGAGGDGGGK